MLYKLNKINFKAKKSSMVKQKKKINIFNVKYFQYYDRVIFSLKFNIFYF